VSLKRAQNATAISPAVSRAMNTNIMKALRFAEFGPPSVLRIEEIGVPEPGEGEALVHAKAAAINPSDIGNVMNADGSIMRATNKGKRYG
jgi:NADPH-dependent curcumin reductase CurA